ncbi:MAG: hypothetical protein D6772_10995, partial [Bacteroidetes bacterium]
MRKLLFWSATSLLFVLGSVSPLAAQKAKLRKAEAAMMALRYQQAIHIYEKIHNKHPDLPEPILALARAYRKLGRLEQAEMWYTKALLVPEVPAEAYYQYGQLLFQQDDCEGAQLAFQTFLQLKPYDERRWQLTDVCAYRAQLFSRGAQRTQLELPDFNGPYSDLGPAFYGKGLVFGSVRPGPNDREAFYDLYYTEALGESGKDYTAVSPFSATINGQMHEAILTFSPDGQEVYFTRNQPGALSEKNPLHLLEIMIARKDSTGQWSQLEPLPFNDHQYSTAHPALSADGQRLFFSSDRPGGFGGTDIYVSQRMGRSWSTPVNLGPKVNTEGDELFPFFHASGELYFASDGQLGLGGQDIFRVEELGPGQWGRVENLGVPINSAADDFGLILNESAQLGYFTSNRVGGKGDDDIYAFRPRALVLELQFTDQQHQALDQAISFRIRGSELAYRTNEKGFFTQKLNFDECLYMQLTDNNFLPLAREICATESQLA